MPTHEPEPDEPQRLPDDLARVRLEDITPANLDAEMDRKRWIR